MRTTPASCAPRCARMAGPLTQPLAPAPCAAPPTARSAHRQPPALCARSTWGLIPPRANAWTQMERCVCQAGAKGCWWHKKLLSSNARLTSTHHHHPSAQCRDPNCSSCRSSLDMCDRCALGHYLNYEASASCERCADPFCSTCDESPAVCTSCFSGGVTAEGGCAPCADPSW